MAIRLQKKNSRNPSSSSSSKFLKRHPSSSMASRSSSFPRASLLTLFLLLFLFAFAIPLYLFSKSDAVLPVVHGGSTQFYTIRVVNEFPHDRNAFTQGLVYGGNDTLYESTGLYGRSSVRKVALQSGKVQLLHEMDKSQFGEGLTLLNDRLIQVTWLKKTGFIYDRNDLSKSEEFTHPMQDGWGLATDGKVLYGSDGSSTLYLMDPRTLKGIGKHTVKYNDYEVHNLNELEFVDNEVWANVYMTDCIARISPGDGVVLSWILLSQLREGLLAAGETDIDVLNGIAWDSDKKRLLVTGKLWPKMYEVTLHRIPGPSSGKIEHLCIRQPFNFLKNGR